MDRQKKNLEITGWPIFPVEIGTVAYTVWKTSSRSSRRGRRTEDPVSSQQNIL